MNAQSPKLSHLDEYEMAFEQINLYQHEIHRTWLWAAMSAAALYTWLELHKSDIVLPLVIWLIPPFLIGFCAIRYCSFWLRIQKSSEYIKKIEEDAFPEDAKLKGYVHHLDERKSLWKSNRFSLCGAAIVWGIMILGSIALSIYLAWVNCSTAQHATKCDYKTVSSTSDEILNTPAAQGWIPVSMSVTPDGNKWFLSKKPKEVIWIFGLTPR